MFFAYWQGFTPSGTAPDDSPALRLTPSYVDVVALAFAVPGPNSTVLTDFLTSKNSQESILADAAILRARGQKVVISINGNADIPWESLDPDTFAASIEALAKAWSLDGIDLDNESPGETPGPVFVATIRAIRKRMGKDFLITYPAFLVYRDQFLSQVKDDLDYVLTMAYWNDFTGQKQLFNSYAQLVGAEKVAIGVKPGTGMGDQATPWNAVPQIARWQPAGGTKAGMMMYSLSIDIPEYTKQPRFTWAEAIAQNLDPKVTTRVTPAAKRTTSGDSPAPAPAPWPARFFAYWLGYVPMHQPPDNRPALRETPSFIDTVALAFAVPGLDSKVDPSFLFRNVPKETILADIPVLRGRGQRVVLSINGNDGIPWESIDVPTFVDSLATLVDRWQLDGVDLDNESPGETPGDNFVAMIRAIRAKFGPKFHISYPAFLSYRDGFLSRVKDELDLVCTMAYWNDFQGQKELFASYASLVGAEKVSIGVKTGKGMGDQSTPWDAVVPCAQYQPAGGRKAGMMLWNVSSDVPTITGQPLFTWANTIQENLP